ncbi:MAG: UbiA prenyltransferase family protein [Anaerolineales bacterium]|nr:UbiA prenyltransferase family protein [Anaerolineales bacterium]
MSERSKELASAAPAAWWQWLDDARLFIRLPALGFTLLLPLLGSASVWPVLDGRLLVGLLCAAVCFHNFSYVLNDVVDLPIDRTQPQRAHYPLVRGRISAVQALAFALLQYPLALLVTWWLRGSEAVYAWLTAAFVLMGIYDVWGKRFFYPPLTDIAQGVGWAALVFYGALLVQQEVVVLTILLAAFIAGFITLLNGVHASLRDLDNDLQWGLRTTAIVLGARPRSPVGQELPRRLLIYTVVGQLLIGGLLVWPVVGNLTADGRGLQFGKLAAVGVIVLWSSYLTYRIVQPQRTAAEIGEETLRFILISNIALFIPFIGFVTVSTFALMLLCGLGPTLLWYVLNWLRPFALK